MEEFFLKLKELDKEKDNFPALDFLFKKVTNLLEERFDSKYFLDILNDKKDLIGGKKYEKVDSLIKEFTKYDFSISLHMGLLTITNVRKTNLKERTELYKITKELLSKTLTEKQVISTLRNLE